MSELSIGGMEVESPWANAGGVVRRVEEVEAMALTGVGWIEAGSYTLEKRLSNAVDPEHPELGDQRIVYYHDSETDETGNSFNMPNQGMDALEDEIPEMNTIAKAYGKNVVYNLAPVTDDLVGETQELFARAINAGARYLLLNGDCPSVLTKDGDRHTRLSHDPLMLGRVLRGLGIVLPQDVKIFFRPSPYDRGADMALALEPVIRSGNVSAIFTPNTWQGTPKDADGNFRLEVPDGIGGISGPIMKDQAADQVRWGVDIVRGTGISVVSSSSIMEPQELKRRLDLGADGGCGTTFYHEPKNGWKEDTDLMIRGLAELEGWA